MFNIFRIPKNLASAFCIILVQNFPLFVQAKGYSIRPNQFDEIVLVEAIEFKWILFNSGGMGTYPKSDFWVPGVSRKMGLRQVKQDFFSFYAKFDDF